MYHTMMERSPYPLKRRPPRQEYDDRPAITLLPADPYMMLRAPDPLLPRPSSPGVYRMQPPKSAKNKGSSFVILGETFTAPVQSRPSSPSGRVSPFRGHGFKSPGASRATSPVMSPTRKVSSKPTPKIGRDIGLPPKSPKRTKSQQLSEHKPTSPKRLAPMPGGKVARARQVYVSKPNSNGVVLKSNKVSTSNIVVPTINNKKKPPVPPKKPGLKPRNPPPVVKIEANKAVKETKKKESTKEESGKTNEKKGEVYKESEPETNSVKNETNERGSLDKGTSAGSAEAAARAEPTERLIPCLQPDRCQIAPPTMASPGTSVTSTTSVSSSSGSVSTAPTSTRVTSSNLSALSTAIYVARKVPTPARPIIQPSGTTVPTPVRLTSSTPGSTTPRPISSTATSTEPILETAVMTVTEEVRVVQRIGDSSTSLKSEECTTSSMVTVRPASNGSLKDLPGDTISTTKLIAVDADVEVLSPNNLLNSPPPRPAWNDHRIPNGNVPSDERPKNFLQRWLSSLWNLLTYLCCCGCCKRIQCKASQCCRKLNCCRLKPEVPPRPSLWSRLCSKLSCPKLCSKLNCCGKLNCCKSEKCCKKLKCCEGRSCCKTKSKSTSKKCCANMCCSCRECCSKVKNCCLSCGDKVNSGCRSLFCLNFLCCQKCLKKCCKCCFKYKCCQRGGCCSCCNPHVKKAKRQHVKVEKKPSHTSSQIKQENAKLDPALVEHTSFMKAAIPVLPTCLAVLCLIFNIFIPGTGTFLSGLFCLCFGKPRFSVNDTPQNRVGSFCVNIVICVSQLFTVIFCLVGWGWSVWWGVIMYKLAKKQKRLKLAEKTQEEAGASAANQNHVDVEQG